jgi:WhiB family redox-sensing transcriptional regulator
MVRLAGDMGYPSRKMMMARRILPAPAMAGRGLDASWRESAACLGADTELFFPAGFAGPAAADIHAAKAFCGRCPVRACCLAYALDTGQTAGIWGGYDENERRFMRQGQRRPALMRDAAGGRLP